MAIAQKMKLPEDKVEGIRIASLIHDIGKIGLPTEILSKPTKLSVMEFDLIKGHSQIGYDILKSIDFPWPVAEIVLQHHEKINGSGYPGGSLKSQMRIANKIAARYTVIVGEEELSKNMITLRNMQTKEQKEVNLGNLINELT